MTSVMAEAVRFERRPRDGLRHAGDLDQMTDRELSRVLVRYGELELELSVVPFVGFAITGHRLYFFIRPGIALQRDPGRCFRRGR